MKDINFLIEGAAIGAGIAIILHYVDPFPGTMFSFKAGSGGHGGHGHGHGSASGASGTGTGTGTGHGAHGSHTSGSGKGSSGKGSSKGGKSTATTAAKSSAHANTHKAVVNTTASKHTIAKHTTPAHIHVTTKHNTAIPAGAPRGQTTQIAPKHIVAGQILPKDMSAFDRFVGNPDNAYSKTLEPYTAEGSGPGHPWGYPGGSFLVEREKIDGSSVDIQSAPA